MTPPIRGAGPLRLGGAGLSCNGAGRGISCGFAHVQTAWVLQSLVSIAKPSAIVGYAAAPALAIKDGAVNHKSWLAPVLDIKYRLDVSSAVAGKALVSPA